ncbi:hypothetical protein G5B88_01020 [Herbaspirillum seropedicae]|uniref:Uncharacterized protein n=1 Tax=Herbaspirillum seropedicae (strain SmR1) TaxID=757424 RepID=D8IV12_HERSS|nr:hypothetical protein [Herbaspirillum seropedicae]ADJ61731.1 hypothetical protein Hsero_0205 [Herbaspirillum seropedicae SmR1]AKN63936.1 hypothetical protein ACP92_01015 [Herbaspirillum seropedicae]NQE29307.1 hypothetical protein [Herbaspirillum seropedicae]UMU19846.1 hypothetical protein G5B88_01020 [Herbaspirillum seropedicae]
MHLEQQISDAIASQNALTQMVTSKMSHLESRINGFIDRWGVDGYTVLEVGACKPYATIADAWYALAGKAIKSDILIKVADGDYACNQIWLAHQPFGSRIRIEGNLNNPQNCILRMTPDADRYSYGVWLERQCLAGFSGFTIVGTQTAQHWTYRGLLLTRQSHLYSTPGTLRFEQCGVEVLNDSYLEAKEMRINDCRGSSISAQVRAIARVENAIITGPSCSAQYALPNGSNAVPYGILVSRDASLIADRSRIANVRMGLYASIHSYAECDEILVNNVDVGVAAYSDSMIYSRAEPDVANCAKVSNARMGFRAWNGSRLFAAGSAVENVQQGYHADDDCFMNAYQSRCINVSTMGYTAINGSQIDAGDTAGRFVNTPNRYNLPANTVGAVNAILYY